MSSNPVHDEVYSIQHYVIKFVSDLRQVAVFFSGTLVSSINKTDGHEIAEILFKMALNTINPNPSPNPNPVKFICPSHFWRSNYSIGVFQQIYKLSSTFHLLKYLFFKFIPSIHSYIRFVYYVECLMTLSTSLFVCLFVVLFFKINFQISFKLFKMHILIPWCTY